MILLTKDGTNKYIVLYDNIDNEVIASLRIEDLDSAFVDYSDIESLIQEANTNAGHNLTYKDIKFNLLEVV